MRRTIRSVGVLIVSLLAALGLVIASAFSAAVAFGAIGFFVPGTGTPNANGVTDYLSNARDRYTQTTECTNATNCPTQLEDPANATLQGINYPATFFPLFFFSNWCTLSRCNTWDDSVGQGTAALNASIAAALANPADDGQQIVVFGYSQGGAVVADSLNGYINSLDAADKARIKIVTIGGIENPDGGLWQRLNFIPFLSYIPFLNVSLNPPMNPNTGVNYTSIGFQYDPVVNAPKYFGNAFALINALAAFENVHGYYLAPNGNGPTDTLPFGYDDTTLAAATNCTTSPQNCKTDKYGNTYITIPATSLPIYNFILSLTPSFLTPLVQPIVNLLTPVTKLLVDLGYDTSGDPSVPTPLSLLPFNPATFNPIDFSLKFVQAIVQGVQDAINGGPTTQVTPAVTQAVTASLMAKSVVTPSTDPTPSADTATPAVDKVVASVEQTSATQAASDKSGTDTTGTDKLGTDTTGTTGTTSTDKSGTDTTGTDKSGTDTAGTDKSGSDATGTTGTDKSSTDATGTDKSGTDTTGTDKSGTDTTGTDKSGTDKTLTDKTSTDKDAKDKADKDKADKAKAEKDAKDAADKSAKDAADKAKANAAANGAAATGSGAKDATASTDTSTAGASTGDAGSSEKSAA